MSAHSDTLISSALRAALQSWLEAQSALKGLSDNTLSAYHTDVVGFMAFMTLHSGARSGLAALARISVSDMRAWMASQRAQQIAPRSLARKLSAVKNFYVWPGRF